MLLFSFTFLIRYPPFALMGLSSVLAGKNELGSFRLWRDKVAKKKKGTCWTLFMFSLLLLASASNWVNTFSYHQQYIL